ncbi:LEAF RUST 10 DISEASE-RESISTANCE LOCUS RECEPTOR-LIKE PROTEIN KINASE-like 1.4 isoform X3 [Pistacia vera]|uniref:LEAF RUST 10 DISEASE-RESISTANCE LOCUS RECEPTOR-LIKE PROTEIN KINASE-like 1.4 isoform X3 n=1 Tax=Pistacia vera TaxID=55513 RepID=UPI001263A584|nr:LEAF RUST 10 DISEASE-RESISTANCE LOCUS RECEPTOR-LIKE PROTEIN KINASE-like 1.4 isoform X3 [Pistacia vera]
MTSFQLFSSSPFLCALGFLILVLVNVQLSLSTPDMSEVCKLQFKCGHITAGYPFWGAEPYSRPGGAAFCGHKDLELYCENDTIIMMINGVEYLVLSINEAAQILKIARLDYWSGNCPPHGLVNATFDSTPFECSPGYENFTLSYDVPDVHRTCFIEEMEKFFSYNDGLISIPGHAFRNFSVTFPVHKTFLQEAKQSLSGLEKALKQGFEVKWKVNGKKLCDECIQSNGSCGPDPWNQTTICHCPDQPFPYFRHQGPCPTPPTLPTGQPSKGPPDTSDEGKKKTTPPKADGGKKKALVIGVAVAVCVVAISLVCCCIFIVLRRRKNVAQYKSRDLQTLTSGTSATSTTMSYSKSISSHLYSKSDLEKGSTYFGAQIFRYAELEEATENFDSSKELGDGGFGTVYYGVLKDGRSVAVKRLYENTVRRVEQFKNEIEILTRLRHPNLVALYGCTSRHSRELLLVYEYISNGTVADHLHGSRSNSGLLTWPIRLNIAIETAEALAFLHVSDVIHRDVKTNNILLDNNFHVKVADFGLSRFFPNDVTHVSTAPQGTPGYVDPEYYQCYQLTEKSDVYSFGVVLIELISSLEAVDTNRHRHDINLANMAISRIQNHALKELVDPSLGFEKDYTIRNMITSVAELAFRCLQQDRDLRPAMQEILEVLREIQSQQFGAQKAEVVDFCSTDDVVLLRKVPPPLSSPDSGGNDKWVSGSTQPASY